MTVDYSITRELILFAREALTQCGRPEREVVALGEDGRLRGGLEVEPRRRGEVAGPLVKVGDRSGVARELGVESASAASPACGRSAAPTATALSSRTTWLSPDGAPPTVRECT